MSGWQLGLALFGLWLAGVGCGVIAVALYARHVYRQKVGQLLGGVHSHLGAVVGTAAGVPPPPPRVPK